MKYFAYKLSVFARLWRCELLYMVSSSHSESLLSKRSRAASSIPFHTIHTYAICFCRCVRSNSRLISSARCLRRPERDNLPSSHYYPQSRAWIRPRTRSRWSRGRNRLKSCVVHTGVTVFFLFRKKCAPKTLVFLRTHMLPYLPDTTIYHTAMRQSTDGLLCDGSLTHTRSGFLKPVPGRSPGRSTEQLLVLCRLVVADSTVLT